MGNFVGMTNEMGGRWDGEAILAPLVDILIALLMYYFMPFIGARFNALTCFTVHLAEMSDFGHFGALWKNHNQI